jgi:DNA-binding response OmpR family regulator
MSACPCCGQKLPEMPLTWSAETRVVMRGDKAVRLAKVKARIFDVLFRVYPSSIARDALIERAWAHDADGGPEWANVASVHMMQMRKQLAPVGVYVGKCKGVAAGVVMEIR